TCSGTCSSAAGGAKTQPARASAASADPSSAGTRTIVSMLLLRIPAHTGRSIACCRRSAEKPRLHAAEQALGERFAPAIAHEIQIALARRVAQQIVARPDLVDEIELERAHAVPVLAGRDALDVHLRSVLDDLLLEERVDVLDLLLELPAAFVGVLAEERQRALVVARRQQLVIDALLVEPAVEVRQLREHTDRADDRER